MKAVTPHAFRVVTPRNRQQLGDTRQMVMERGIEASDLRKAGEVATERFDQKNFLRQMLGVEGTEFAERSEHFERDALGLPVSRAAVNDAMSHGDGEIVRELLLEPSH